jgi:nicotinate-nucleotide adenylyltransferase
MKRVGILGGSFNPAHRGHRRISIAAIDALGLDEVWWLVSPGNPLKPAEGMAPFEARLQSARRMARRAPIRVSDFETCQGTRFTIDTLSALIRRYPAHRFVWLMGSDTIAQFHRWKSWRNIVRRVPIAVIARPGYDGPARAARAMGWLRRFVRPSRQARKWTEWSAPAILLLRLPPDPTSATALRAFDPNWHRQPKSRSSGPGEPHAPLTDQTLLNRPSSDRSKLARSSSR